MGTLIFIALLVGIPFYYKVWELKESKKETEEAIGLMAKLLYDNEESLSQWKAILRRAGYENSFHEAEKPDHIFMRGYGGSVKGLKRQIKIMRMAIERAEGEGTFPFPPGYPKIIEPEEKN